ncbi:secreted antigen 1 [Babesia caballi]|uniref:Secreted antigen 1 n=1 Tax=Babesia caballi TaxID=5871 RepID=A0AAV4LV35_BABCB|nr:secreted antigen 1 [Babesia caballi]
MLDCLILNAEFLTLKDCLDYVIRIKEETTLLERIDKTLGSTFNSILKTEIGYSTFNLQSALTNIDTLRQVLVKHRQDHGKYMRSVFSEDCLEAYLYNLAVCLYKLYGVLLFLVFNTTKQEEKRDSGGGGGGGGYWSTLKSNENNNPLHQWLTREVKTGSGLLEGGFTSEDLKGTNGDTILNAISQNGGFTESLKKYLCAMIFLPPWLPEKTAIACLLLKDICSHVSESEYEENLKRVYYDDGEQIQAICKKLNATLSTFSDGSGSVLALVAKKSNITPTYKVKENFDLCFWWLKAYLPDLVESLERMKKRCVYWTAEDLQNARTPGPFLYGFAFTDLWKNPSDWSSVKLKLATAIDELVRDLLDLNKILNPTSHAVAIGLGVVSTVLVGGSAAAAYFYPGLLSSTIHMIVG